MGNVNIKTRFLSSKNVTIELKTTDGKTFTSDQELYSTTIQIDNDILILTKNQDSETTLFTLKQMEQIQDIRDPTRKILDITTHASKLFLLISKRYTVAPKSFPYTQNIDQIEHDSSSHNMDDSNKFQQGNIQFQEVNLD